jgi:hypothetical protein
MNGYLTEERPRERLCISPLPPPPQLGRKCAVFHSSDHHILASGRPVCSAMVTGYHNELLYNRGPDKCDKTKLLNWSDYGFVSSSYSRTDTKC